MSELKVRSNLTLKPQSRDWLSKTGNESAAVDLLVDFVLAQGWSLHDVVRETEKVRQQSNDGTKQLLLLSSEVEVNACHFCDGKDNDPIAKEFAFRLSAFKKVLKLINENNDGTAINKLLNVFYKELDNEIISFFYLLAEGLLKHRKLSKLLEVLPLISTFEKRRFID